MVGVCKFVGDKGKEGTCKGRALLHIVQLINILALDYQRSI
jgi:hypothetical protein